MVSYWYFPTFNRCQWTYTSELCGRDVSLHRVEKLADVSLTPTTDLGTPATATASQAKPGPPLVSPSKCSTRT
jgi:hypothetical protein